ncbi:MAG: penicillin-binding protein 2 [Chlamydiota bacterium]
MTSVSLESRKRLVWVFLFIFFLFSLLIIQYYRIQIIEGDKWTKHALGQHQLVVIEPFKRGLFYSNSSIKAGHPDKPQPFVIDVPKYHLYIDPASLPQETKGVITNQLIEFLRLNPPEQEKLRLQFDKKSRSRRLVMWLSKAARDEITEWWLPFARSKKIARNALFFVQDYKRSYPFGKLLGQVLHTVREERDVKTHQSIPTGGLELVFNEHLKGKEGKRLILRSPRHPLETGKVLYQPEDGADVYLTINHYLQAIAEEEIAKAVKKARAKGGWAIIMEPRTGEIWALAQYPWFEPAYYAKYFNDDKSRENTKVKAVTDPYEPGSTMKPITLAVCLQANAELKKRGKPPIFSPHEKVKTSVGKFPGRSKPLYDPHPHRYLNMNMALYKSSNVYMATMVYRAIDALGVEWYRNALHNTFGFGLKTGVEIPSECGGLLPSLGKKHANGAPEWSGGTPCSLSFGYNILVNSLQMLRAYAIIANGGYDVRPTLVRKIVKKNSEGKEEVLLDNTRAERVLEFKRLLDPEIIEALISAMKFVTKPGGTASRADIYGYTDAGKTSTSEKIINGVYSKKNHISTMIGFAPAKEAKFVIFIAIDEPEFKYIPGIGKNQMGGTCAAPVFRELGTRTLQFLGVEPDDPYGYPPGDPRRDPEKADWIKKTEELKALYDQWNHET